MAHSLVFNAAATPTPAAQPRIAIITTLAASAILPTLRDVIRCQVETKEGPDLSKPDAQVKQCLGRISISRIFDMEGLWEVLTELEMSLEPDPEAKSENRHDEEVQAPVSSQPPGSSPLSPLAPSPPATTLPPLRTKRVEVADSEDEDSLSSSEMSSPAASLQTTPKRKTKPDLATPPTGTPEKTASRLPDIILITHFSALLTTLFTQRDKQSAHTSLQLLSSHLRYLSRSSGPLIMLLNVTTSPLATSSAAAQAPLEDIQGKRPIDPSLRSIFNPPPPSTAAYGSAGLTLSRRNKPAFGLTFAQFLDLHLLCTRVPRTREDAEAVYAPSPRREMRDVRCAWVVEVLSDEAGVWDTERWRCREQRWGAVDVKDGRMLVDAFEQREHRLNTERIRLAAGFGGPKV